MNLKNGRLFSATNSPVARAIYTLAAALLLAHAAGAAITGVSIPVGSQDGGSYPLDDNVWSVQAPPYPLNISSGIGHIINPSLPSPSFSLHDHVYIASNIPDPTRATVTYTFDTSTIVKGIEIVQHTNGITRIAGFSGNSLGSLVSIGSVFGPSGDIVGSRAFSEGLSQVFDFGNTTVAGTFFEWTVRKTSLHDGWANYRAFPLDVNGNRIVAAVPEPEIWAMLLVGSGLVGFQLRRKGKAAGTNRLTLA